MKSEDYILNALVTENTDFEGIRSRLQDDKTIRILHAVIGISTEAAEMLDAIKKHLIYGKPLDLVNLEEEHGDLMWYEAILSDALGKSSFSGAMQKNIEKLRSRYPNKFNEHSAINRNLEIERKILESAENQKAN